MYYNTVVDIKSIFLFYVKFLLEKFHFYNSIIIEIIFHKLALQSSLKKKHNFSSDYKHSPLKMRKTQEGTNRKIGIIRVLLPRNNYHINFVVYPTSCILYVSPNHVPVFKPA